MGTLIVMLLLVWLGLMALLAAWTVFFQGYIYTEPVEGIIWRAPAAGSAVALFLMIWVVCDYRAPGQYQALQDFSPRIDLPSYKEFRIINPDGMEEVYKEAKNEKGKLIYKNEKTGREAPARPQQVIVKENDEDVTFEPDRDAKEQFKAQKGRSLYYHDKKGRSMVEGQIGQLMPEFRLGNLVLNLVLNFLHLAIWFAMLWLVLQYRMWHALGLALVAWIALTLVLLPPVLSKAEEVARQRAAVKTEA